MLNAGVEVYTELEASIGGERVNYANVFRHLEETTGVRVTYGSVHERIWDSQRDFQIDVLRRAAAQLVEHSTAGAESAAAEIIASSDLSTSDGKRIATREIVRLVGDANSAALLNSPLSRLQRRIAYRFAGLPEHSNERTELHDALKEGFMLGEAHFIEVYLLMMKTLGLRPRRDLFSDETEAMRAMTRLGRALVDGALIVDSVTDNERLQLPTGPDGEMQEWSLGAMGAWAMVQAILEIDGVDDPFEARL